MKKIKNFISKHPAGAWALISICVFCFVWCANSELVAGREKPYINVWANYIVADGTPGSGITEPGANLHVISDSAPVTILDLDNTTDWLTMDFRRQGQRTASFGVSASDAYGGNAFVLGSFDADWTNPLIVEQGAPTNSFYIKSNGSVGINTTKPGEKLTIAGLIQLVSGPSGAKIEGYNPSCGNNSGGIKFRTRNGNTGNYDTRLVIKCSNIGVGTMEPKTLLHISAWRNGLLYEGAANNNDAKGFLQSLPSGQYTLMGGTSGGRLYFYWKSGTTYYKYEMVGTPF